MTSGGARRGRRDNGLVAASYAAAGDVDPRVGEHLLDVLALRGIAAYLQPAADLHPVTFTTTLPARPTDRLFVDADHLDTARDYLAQLGPETAPESDGGDLDEAFASIVAGYDEEVDATPWPAVEDLPGGRAGGGVTGGDAGPAGPRRAGPAGREPDARSDGGASGDVLEPPAGPGGFGLSRWTPRPTPRGGPDDEPSLLDGLDTFGAGLPDDEEDFTPPPPPPLPRFSITTVVAVIVVIVGVVLLFRPQLLPIDDDVTLALAVCAVVGGFVALLWRLRPGGEDDEDDPTGGAIV